MIFPEATGTPLRTLLAAGEPVPEAEVLEALLDALPTDLMTFPRRRSQLRRVKTFAGVLRQTVDPGSVVLSGLDDVVGQLTDGEYRPGEPVPVHGDFYEGQLLAHLLTAAMTNEREPVRRYAEAVLNHAQRRVAPADLRRRTAAGLLGLATGPLRVQQPKWAEHTAARIRLARDWLAGGG